MSHNEESEADRWVHVGSRDGTVSLDQHTDEESDEEPNVGRVRLVVLLVVRNQDEGDEEDQGQSGQTFGKDLPPESDRLDFRQGTLWRAALHGFTRGGRTGFRWNGVKELSLQDDLVKYLQLQLTFCCRCNNTEQLLSLRDVPGKYL